MERGQVRLEEQFVYAKRLGRHIDHDPKSRDFPATGAAIQSVFHLRRLPILDQGSLGSCTGNAMAGLLCTDPNGRVMGGLDLAARWTEDQAIDLYKLATRLDGFDGTYPPEDTGSSGLGVAKAAKRYGLISSYWHAFGLEHALRALTLRPVIFGINWYEGFDNPDEKGLVKIEGSVRGGHEVEACGINTGNYLVYLANSWGPMWGLQGYFTMSFDDLGQLLDEGGDCTTVHPFLAA